MSTRTGRICTGSIRTRKSGQAKRARRTVALGMALALACAVLGGAAAAASESSAPVSAVPEPLAGSPGLGLGALAANLIYAPAKLLVAGGGTIAGGLLWVLSGGDDEVAQGILRPALTGDYVLTPRHLAGRERVAILGASQRAARRLAREGSLPPVSGGLPSTPASREERAKRCR